MEVDSLSSLSFVPFCLHEENDEIKYAYISNSTLTKKNKKIRDFFLECPKGKVFYAIIPAFVPIPTDTILITLENSKTDPKYTKNVRQETDPNILNLKDRVSFITWSRKIPYTVPLYFYKKDEKVFPSFKKQDFLEEIISPIYVVPEYINYNDKKIPGYKLGFFCYQDYRCIIDPESDKTLLDCVISCNQSPPENLFQYIQNNFMKSKNKNIPIWYFIILFISFFLILTIFIKQMLKSKV